MMGQHVSGMVGQHGKNLQYIFMKMKSKEGKTFDSVAFFRSIKEKLSRKMQGMNLSEKKEYLRQIREGKIRIEPGFATQ